MARREQESEEVGVGRARECLVEAVEVGGAREKREVIHHVTVDELGAIKASEGCAAAAARLLEPLIHAEFCSRCTPRLQGRPVPRRCKLDAHHAAHTLTEKEAGVEHAIADAYKQRQAQHGETMSCFACLNDPALLPLSLSLFPILAAPHLILRRETHSSR